MLRRLWPLAALALVFAVFFALDLDSYLSFESLGQHRSALLTWVHDNAVLAVITLHGRVCRGADRLPAIRCHVNDYGRLLVWRAAGRLLRRVCSDTGRHTPVRYCQDDGRRIPAGAGPALGFSAWKPASKRTSSAISLCYAFIPLFPFWLVKHSPGVPRCIAAQLCDWNLFRDHPGHLRLCQRRHTVWAHYSKRVPNPIWASFSNQRSCCRSLV